MTTARMGTILFIVSLLWLLIHLPPSVSFGDSAELAAAAGTLGIAHPPGYPLYVLGGRLFSSLLPLGNPAYRMNLFSAMAAAFSLLLLARSGAGRASSSSAGPFLLASLVLLQAPAFLKSSLSSEVFALNLACLGGVWWSLCGGRFRLCFLLWGLGLGNQHTLLLLAPAIFFGAGIFRADSKRRALESLFFLALGLSLYVYLPLRSLQAPLLDWEDPESWERFWGVVSRSRYGTLALAQGGAETPWTLARAWESVLAFFTLWASQLGIVGAGLAVLGAFQMWRRNPSNFWLWLAAFLCAGPLFFVLAKVRSGLSTHEMMERFLLAPLWLSAVGIGNLSWDFPGRSLPRTARRLAGVGLVLFLGGSAIGAAREHSGRQSFWLWDYGRNVLRTLPAGSTLFADRADETEFVLAYLQKAEARRLDVVFVDCNAGVTRSLYGKEYYRIWGPPRLRIRERLEGLWARRFPRPVYYATVDPQMVAVPRRRQGILWECLPPRGKAIQTDWSQLYIFRRTASGGLASGGRREMSLRANAENLLGSALLDQGSREAAYRHFSWLALEAPSYNWWPWIGAQFFERGFSPEAERAYRQALRREPRSIDAHYNLGVLYWRQGRWEEVVKAFEKVLALDPSHEGAGRFLPQARSMRVR